MIVPKNKQFVIQSVDNFYKLFVMYILNFLGISITFGIGSETIFMELQFVYEPSLIK